MSKTAKTARRRETSWMSPPFAITIAWSWSSENTRTVLTISKSTSFSVFFHDWRKTCRSTAHVDLRFLLTIVFCRSTDCDRSRWQRSDKNMSWRKAHTLFANISRLDSSKLLCLIFSSVPAWFTKAGKCTSYIHAYLYHGSPLLCVLAPLWGRVDGGREDTNEPLVKDWPSLDVIDGSLAVDPLTTTPLSASCCGELCGSTITVVLSSVGVSACSSDPRSITSSPPSSGSQPFSMNLQ